MNRTIKSILCAILSLVLVLSSVSAFAEPELKWDSEKHTCILKASQFWVRVILHKVAEDGTIEEHGFWLDEQPDTDYQDFRDLRDSFLERSTITYEDIYGVEHGEAIVESPAAEEIPEEEVPPIKPL